MHILGECVKGLVVSNATARIELFGPFGTLSHDILANLGQLAKLGDSGWAVIPNKMYFSWCIQVCS